MKPNLSVVAPAYNEAGNLPEFIKKTVVALKKITSNFEIIIIDDGFTLEPLDQLKNRPLFQCKIE